MPARAVSWPCVERLTDRNFTESVLDARGLTLVDFFSFWCGPCQHRRGTLERLAMEYGGVVRFARCDVDENPRMPATFGVTAAPALLLFESGHLVARLSGVATRTEIRELIERQVHSQEPHSA